MKEENKMAFVKNYNTLLSAILSNCPRCNKTCAGNPNNCDINPHNYKNYRKTFLSIRDIIFYLRGSNEPNKN